MKPQIITLDKIGSSELGYITIAADASYQGASGGTPRHKDVPYYRTEDIHGMADFISKYPK